MPVFLTDDFSLIDVNDQTKELRFDVSAMTTGTIRTLKVTSFSTGTHQIATLENPNPFSAIQSFTLGFFAVSDSAVGASITLQRGSSGSTAPMLRMNNQASSQMGCMFDSNGSLARVFMADNTDKTKVLFVDLSGISTATTRTVTIQNMTGAWPTVGDDPPAVAAGALGKVDDTGLSAATSSTNLTNGALSGVYVLHYEMTCTTGDGTAGSLTFDTIATGDQGAQTISSASLPLTTAVASATNPVRGSIVRYRTSGEVAYSTTVTGAFNAARAALRVRVLYLG